MRIYLILSKTNQIIPYSYQHLLTSTLHGWLGTNEFHGNPSLFSFSHLYGAKDNKQGLSFPKGARWFISAHYDEIILHLIERIKKASEMFYGLNVEEIVIQETPDLSERTVFDLGSPVFIKRHENGRTIHYTYKQKEANDLLTQTQQNKMQKYGFENTNISIRFDPEYRNSRTKLIDYKGIKNKVNISRVIIEGSAEAKAFAWNAGIGNSTGIGFGSII